MGCGSSSSDTSLFGTMCDNFVKDTGNADSLIAVRNLDQSTRLSLMGIVVKRTKEQSDKVVYRPYNFHLNDILDETGVKIKLDTQSKTMFSTWKPHENSSIGGSIGGQLAHGIAKIGAHLSSDDQVKFDVGNVAVLELDSNELVKILTRRTMNLNHPVVSQVRQAPGAVLCLVHRTVVTDEKATISHERKRQAGGDVTVPAVSGYGGNVEAHYDSNTGSSMELVAGTILAYSVWELQINTTDRKILPMILSDSHGGFIKDNANDIADGLKALTLKERFEKMTSALDALLSLPPEDRKEYTSLLQTIMKVPKDTKITDFIFDEAGDALRDLGDSGSSKSVDLEKEGVTNVNICSNLLQKAGFKLKKSPSVLLFPGSTTAMFDAIDYVFDMTQDLRDSILCSVGECTPQSAAAIIRKCNEVFGVSKTGADSDVDIYTDAAADAVILEMGLTYDQKAKKLTYQGNNLSPSTFDVYSILYALHGTK